MNSRRGQILENLKSRFVLLGLALWLHACAHPEIKSPPSVPARGQLTVVSWNTKHLGRKNFDSTAVAGLFEHADILTFQEVNTSKSGQGALKEIATQLSLRSGEKICWALSEIPTEANERYGYLWKNSKISYIKTNGQVLEDCPSSALTIRLGVKNAQKIVREPSYGVFRLKANGARFVLASIHLVPASKGPEKEVPALFETLRNESLPVIVAGDFNLNATHSVYFVARQDGYQPALVGVKTSLKKSERSLSRPYDNFWYRGLGLSQVQVLNLYELFPNMNKDDIYNNLSDHCPIVAVFEFKDHLQ